MDSPSFGEFLVRMGGFVRNRRTKMRLKQSQLADLVGVNRTTISAIERGRTQVGLARLFQIAEALQCDVVNLIPMGPASSQQVDQLPVSVEEEPQSDLDMLLDLALDADEEEEEARHGTQPD